MTKYFVHAPDVFPKMEEWDQGFDTQAAARAGAVEWMQSLTDDKQRGGLSHRGAWDGCCLGRFLLGFLGRGVGCERGLFHCSGTYEWKDTDRAGVGGDLRAQLTGGRLISRAPVMVPVMVTVMMTV